MAMALQIRSCCLLAITRTTALLVAALLFWTSAPTIQGFGTTTTTSPYPAHHRFVARSGRPSSFALQAASSLVVVSPPGGVGEVTAVKAAEQGCQVQWFVVKKGGINPNDASSSSSSSDDAFALSQAALDKIDTAGGKIEVAGADIQSLLSASDAEAAAAPAIAAWCKRADAIVCTFDGVEAAVSGKKKKDQEEDPTEAWKDAIKIATKEIASACRPAKRIAILAASDDEQEGETGKSSADDGISALVGSLFKPKMNLPSTLSAALGMKDVIKLRHGTLFGIPESSPDFSPLVGGLRKEPELCEELRMRSVRIDPILSVSGNRMMDERLRSSRHAIGEAAALVSQGILCKASPDIDVFISSQQGREAVSVEDWEREFERVDLMMKSGEAAQLFSYDFASVPNTERLTDWLATKWAPAVLRTYDIAAIRTGARPVYALKTDKGTVEIVWQELVNFDTVNVGRMLIKVGDTRLTATRTAGDASKGFGAVSPKPLAGEDVLVRQLAEAASQAVEKGLATKPRFIETPKKEKKVAVAAPAQTMVVSGNVVEPTVSNESGPRAAGARRSTPRKRRKPTDSDGLDPEPEPTAAE